MLRRLLAIIEDIRDWVAGIYEQVYLLRLYAKHFLGREHGIVVFLDDDDADTWLSNVLIWLEFEIHRIESDDTGDELGGFDEK